MRVLAFPDEIGPAAALARAIGAECDVVEVHRFPDAESRLRLPAELPDHVVVYRTLDRPNEKLVELMLAARGARALGTSRITLVAPYLCYMRQDVAFHPGEVVSQRVIGRFLADLFDALVTVDPHLHRVHALEDAVPVARAVALTAATAMGEFIAARGLRPLLVGPDVESAQWVRTVAATGQLEFVVAEKSRRGDADVEVRLPARDYRGVHAVVVDDLASTGRTLAQAVGALRSAGARRVDVLVTHALFVGDALNVLARAGVAEVWSSDSVPHPTNAFSLVPMLARAIA